MILTILDGKKAKSKIIKSVVLERDFENSNEGINFGETDKEESSHDNYQNQKFINIIYEEEKSEPVTKKTKNSLKSALKKVTDLLLTIQ